MSYLPSGPILLMFGVMVSIIVALQIVTLLLQRRKSNCGANSYRAKTTLLTPPELTAFNHLKSTLPSSIHICPKPRLADFLTVHEGKWITGFNRISQKHVDFLLIDSSTGRPMLAIEIDDLSHGKPLRIARDQFVESAFTQAGIPLARFAANHSFTVADIQRLFDSKSA